MKLVLVESPTKAKTLTRYLGGDYRVEATYGHIRDLPEKKIGVDISKNEKTGDFEFKPDYSSTSKQKERIESIKSGAKKTETIYLATDPDREGEAIAYHVRELLKNGKDGGVSEDKFKRIVFHEITRSAIEEAIAHPRGIDMPLVDAQQARRVVDRLVGYKLSPLLWKKVRRGLSAGRVQSVAVRLIVEREKEIEAFVPVEYWDILVVLEKGMGGDKIEVKLVELDGKKLEVGNSDDAGRIVEDLKKANYKILSVEKKQFSRTPPPPYTTSSMQQAAANKMGWSAKKTMQVAQSLYEEGYITYHRTDSTNIANEAAYAAKVFISKNFGSNYALLNPRFYKTKSKVAQEAHEAVRPTSMDLMELSVETNRDQHRLYEMIWKRFMATQMEEAKGESVKVRVNGIREGKTYGLDARGETISFDGWYKLLGKDTDEKRLPEMFEGDELSFVDIKGEQKFTQPPARYNDASLIKTLEEMGIGRPSTYAPTISTIQERNYVERVEKRFKPTALGVAVNDFLVTNFSEIVDYQFTANMEDDLDNVANGEKDWQKIVGGFWGPFSTKLEEVGDTASRVSVKAEETGEICPVCKVGNVVIRIGKFGKFLACDRYPECTYKANFQNKIGVKCPKCGDGDVIMRKTKFKKSFYGCSNYPKCDYASWNKPVANQNAGEVKEEKVVV
jgi:DNA topoisomerase-1